MVTRCELRELVWAVVLAAGASYYDLADDEESRRRWYIRTLILGGGL